jgi:MerR-like DNA binding protein
LEYALTSSIGAEMNIGELARRSGVPSTALRYYEKAGLLPESRRTPAGYRTFQPDTLPRLAFIRQRRLLALRSPRSGKSSVSVMVAQRHVLICSS